MQSQNLSMMSRLHQTSEGINYNFPFVRVKCGAARGPCILMIDNIWHLHLLLTDRFLK